MILLFVQLPLWIDFPSHFRNCGFPYGSGSSPDALCSEFPLSVFQSGRSGTWCVTALVLLVHMFFAEPRGGSWCLPATVSASCWVARLWQTRQVPRIGETRAHPLREVGHQKLSSHPPLPWVKLTATACLSSFAGHRASWERVPRISAPPASAGLVWYSAGHGSFSVNFWISHRVCLWIFAELVRWGNEGPGFLPLSDRRFRSFVKIFSHSTEKSVEWKPGDFRRRGLLLATHGVMALTSISWRLILCFSFTPWFARFFWHSGLLCLRLQMILSSNGFSVP